MNITYNESLLISLKIKNMISNKEYFTPLIDIFAYPAKINNHPPGTKVVLGDLHGNAQKLLHALITEGIVLCEKKYFDQFSIIYKKFSKFYEKHEKKKKKNKKQSENQNAKEKEIRAKLLIALKAILQKIELNPAFAENSFCFAGDEVADRGANDLFTLLLMSRLHDEKLNYEILASNHGYEFLIQLAYGLIKEPVMNFRKYSETLDYSNYANSYYNLKKEIEDEIISLSEVEELINKVYLPKLKIFSTLSNKDKSLTLISHAPITARKIIALAAFLDVNINAKEITELEFNAFTNEKMIDFISRINSCFNDKIANTEKLTHFIKELHANRKFQQFFYDVVNDRYGDIKDILGITFVCVEKKNVESAIELIEKIIFPKEKFNIEDLNYKIEKFSDSIYHKNVFIFQEQLDENKTQTFIYDFRNKQVIRIPVRNDVFSLLFETTKKQLPWKSKNQQQNEVYIYSINDETRYLINESMLQEIASAVKPKKSPIQKNLHGHVGEGTEPGENMQMEYYNVDSNLGKLSCYQKHFYLSYNSNQVLDANFCNAIPTEKWLYIEKNGDVHEILRELDSEVEANFSAEYIFVMINDELFILKPTTQENESIIPASYVKVEKSDWENIVFPKMKNHFYFLNNDFFIEEFDFATVLEKKWHTLPVFSLSSSINESLFDNDLFNNDESNDVPLPNTNSITANSIFKNENNNQGSSGKSEQKKQEHNF